MRTVSEFLIVAYIVLLAILTYLAVSYRDSDTILKEWNVNGERIEIPWSGKFKGLKHLTLEKEILSRVEKRTYLVLSAIRASSLSVTLNGVSVFRLGYDGGFLNLETLTLVVELDLKEGINSLKVNLWGSGRVEIRRLPYLTEKPDYRVPLSNLIFTTVNILGVGALLVGFVYNLIMSVIRGRAYYLNFALSNISLALYLFGRTFTPIPFNFDGFVLLRKMAFSSVYFVIPFISFAVNQMIRGKIEKISLVLFFIGLLLSSGAFLSDFPMDYVKNTSAYFIIIAFYVIHLVRRANIWSLKLGSFVIGAAAFQEALYLFDVSPVPSLMGHATLASLVIFIVFLSQEIRGIERELFKTKRDLFLDPLTGAYNRRIMEVLDTGSNDSVVFFDIDDLKEINDRFGHERGDEVLRNFVSIVESMVRNEDVLMRYGGDEFVLILKNCDVEKAKDIASNIEKALKKAGMHVSWGISGVGMGIESAIKDADLKMYAMKRSRKGTRKYSDHSL